MRLFAIFMLSNVCCLADCLPVSGDRILGRDLALAAFPPSMTIAFAPVPGQSRILRSADIVRLAKANGITLSGPVGDVCFEFPMRAIVTEDVTAAMQRSLPAGAVLEIVELPSGALPAGELHFPLTSLEPGSDLRTWRGYVQYTPTRRSPTSAKVRIRYTAAVTPAIRRGDLVRVDVRSGTARLQLDAIAQKDARDGEVAEFLNPASGKRFRARLEGSVPVVTVGGQF